jgi:polysaccharide transporter, PST family
LRVLGVENFGVFTLIQTALMYFDLLISFGFGLTATQHISLHANDRQKTSVIISTVYSIKFILFLFSLLVTLVCCIFFPFLRDNILIVLISPLYLLGNMLFPDWYFQGIQKMRNITIVAFISKLVSLALIILLVKKSTDIVFAVLAMSVGNFIAGIVGLVILLKLSSLKFFFPQRAMILSMFWESSYVFISIILAPLYSSVNLFILQGFTNPLMVGYYAIAEKIFSAIGMLTNIANRTFFPHLSQLYNTSITAYKKNIKNILLLFVFSFTVLALVQFFAAKEIIKLIVGKKYQYDVSYSVQILKIMSIGLLFSPYIAFFFQLLVLQGQKQKAIANVAITVVVNLISGCTLAYFYSGKGMAVNLCMIVFLIAFLNYRGVYQKLKEK